MEFFQFRIAVHIHYLLIIICLAEVKCKSMSFPLHKDGKGTSNGLKRLVLERPCVYIHWTKKDDRGHWHFTSCSIIDDKEKDKREELGGLR